MKIMKAWMSLAMAATMGLFAYADSTKFGVVTVDYGSATTNWVNGELVLTYKSSSSLAILGGAVKADILVVGGGGGGGGGYSSSYAGCGGDGGQVKEANREICGEVVISVGAGGGGGTSRVDGTMGGESSIDGYGIEQHITALGGAAGIAGQDRTGASAGTGASGKDTTGVASTITGKTQTYGVGGAQGTASAPSAGSANTGNGGGGGRASSTTANRKGGAGGSGVVIVRLTAVTAVYDVTADVTLKDMTLGVDEEISAFAEKSTGAAVDIIHGEVIAANFEPENVARGERTKEGLFALVGVHLGETTATIVIRNEQEKSQTTYQAKVKVTPSIFLKNLSIQRGETADSLVPEGSDKPIDLDYDSVKALKSSIPAVADFVKLPNGKIGVVGKVTGTVDMTIVTEGQSYQFKVTVEKLLSGLYKAGAYDVVVSNASDVSYVDGDLVLIYRNVDAAVKKSFELPKDMTGRLLAVGGGGAGGQGNSKRDDTKGIPGGGGAGGLVIVDSQTFKAEKHMVVVGAGGVAPRTKTQANGANGADTTVTFGGKTLVKAVGGGGGGALDVGTKGGSGGGGSYGTSGNGGGEKDTSVAEYGNAGGYGRDVMFGAGGGGAGGAGGDTTASTNFYKYSSRERKYVFDDPTSANIFLSGAGGAGLTCDITGENLEYARGGAGGVPRLYTHYYYPPAISHRNTRCVDRAGKYFLEYAA